MKQSKSQRIKENDSLREWNSKRKKKSTDIADCKKMLSMSSSDAERLICCAEALKMCKGALQWLKQRKLQRLLKMGPSRHMTCLDRLSRLQGIITREKTSLTVKNLQAKDLKL
jgi:uncharacterized protein (DUF2344 family)